MRRAFAACIAFAILVVVVAVRFGFQHPSLPPPSPDAAIADAAPVVVDAAPVLVDAAPLAKKPVAKRPVPKPLPKPPPKPVVSPPVVPPPVQPVDGTNPAGCPATQPNINHPCDAEGVHCVYGASRCPPVYVCNHGAFEAWFTSCR